MRKWGRRLAVIVPPEVAMAQDLRPGDRALLRIKKVRYPDPRSFGFLRETCIEAQKL